MAANSIQRVSTKHDHIIDWLLAHPMQKNLGTSLCVELNVTRAWLSTLMSSDAFKAEYTRRRAEYNSKLADTVQAKLYETASLALDKVIESLGDEEVDPRFALDAVDKATNRLGFGPSKGATAHVELHQTNLQVVSKDMLASARGKMKSVIDVQTTPLLEEG